MGVRALALHGVNRTEAFVELFSLQQRSLYGFIYTLVHNQADAEDLLQQTSLILWRKFESFEIGTDFNAWAHRIAHLEVLNFLKRKRRSRVCFSDELLAKLATVRTDRADLHAADRDTLLGCIEKLGDSDRRLIQCCYAEKQNIKSAAAELGRPAASIYTSLSRIRRLLLACIRHVDEEDRP